MPNACGVINSAFGKILPGFSNDWKTNPSKVPHIGNAGSDAMRGFL
jgi:hypothetical protein